MRHSFARFTFRSVFFVLLAAGCCSGPPAKQDVADYTDLELPAHTNQERVYRRTAYSITFDTSKHVPKWVAYKLSPEKVRAHVAKRGHMRFSKDAEVPGAPSPAEYSHSSYQRGHMIPAADCEWSADAMKESFLITNAAPQSKELNNGVWKVLEGDVRGWAQSRELYVVTGPVLTQECIETIGKGICAPAAFFKAVLDAAAEKAIAFVVPHRPSGKDPSQYAVSIDELEKRTGLDFFPALPDDIETRVEARARLSDWPSPALARHHAR